jgi:hypothetical protein
VYVNVHGNAYVHAKYWPLNVIFRPNYPLYLQEIYIIYLLLLLIIIFILFFQ